MKTLLALLFVMFLISCAHPEEAMRVYNLNVYATCYASGCTIDQQIEILVEADVQKEQKADAESVISPTVDVAP